MLTMIHKILTVPLFALLHPYTAAGLLFVIVLSWLKAKKPVYFLCKIWAKSVFIIIGKRLPITGRENIDRQQQRNKLKAEGARLNR